MCGYHLWFDNHQSYITYDSNQYVEDIFANRIKTYLNNRKDNKHKMPFFIYWSMPTPHTPITIPPKTTPDCDHLIGETRQTQCNMLYYADLLIGDINNDIDFDDRQAAMFEDSYVLTHVKHKTVCLGKHLAVYLTFVFMCFSIYLVQQSLLLL